MVSLQLRYLRYKNTNTATMYTINCRGKLLDLNTPKIMGIINCTPDSFYDGSSNLTVEHFLLQAQKMQKEGADILDIGGQSSRPGSTRIDADEEMKRVLPVIHALRQHLPDMILSIDTYHQPVAQAAFEAGVSIVNDISAGELDARMIPWVGENKLPYTCMHMQGRPETMQDNPTYNEVTTDIIDFFIPKLDQCRKAGIVDVIIDPGFGFGKTMDHNFSLLKNLNQLSILNCPILAGVSRKGMIYKTLNSSASEALNGTTVLHTIALLQGAKIVRVHDVKEAKEAILLTEKIK
jgi:dihydropteroate synthase